MFELLVHIDDFPQFGRGRREYNDRRGRVFTKYLLLPVGLFAFIHFSSEYVLSLLEQGNGVLLIIDYIHQEKAMSAELISSGWMSLQLLLRSPSIKMLLEISLPLVCRFEASICLPRTSLQKACVAITVRYSWTWYLRYNCWYRKT